MHHVLLIESDTVDSMDNRSLVTLLDGDISKHQVGIIFDPAMEQTLSTDSNNIWSGNYDGLC